MSNRREVLAAALAAGLVADAAGAAEPTAKSASRIDDINAILAVEKLYEDGCVEGSGGFGGLFALDAAGMEEPVLVSGTDGVGTKLKIAMLLNKHDTIGIDCVAMCVNDVICCGAKPLFFLDYIACGMNVPEQIASFVAGVAEGCEQAEVPARRSTTVAYLNKVFIN